MSQFDESTESEAQEYVAQIPEKYVVTVLEVEVGYKNGRNSAKESLEILARAVDEYQREHENPAQDYLMRKLRRDQLFSALATVKALGDWPLDEGANT